MIARIHDKGALPPLLTQNLQMMRSKSREEDPNVNIVLKSGIAIGDNKKTVHGFAKPSQKRLSSIWSTLVKPSWKIRRASLRSPPQEARISLS